MADIELSHTLGRLLPLTSQKNTFDERPLLDREQS